MTDENTNPADLGPVFLISKNTKGVLGDPDHKRNLRNYKKFLRASFPNRKIISIDVIVDAHINGSNSVHEVGYYASTSDERNHPFNFWRL